MKFSQPFALLWLLALPVIISIGWPARGYNRKREILSLITRVILCIFLILALSGLEVRNLGGNSSLAVVFILDVSDSMPAASLSTAMDFIKESLKAMSPDDQSALIVFGKEPLVEYPMSSIRELDTITSIPSTSQTNLSQAINLGLALYPPSTARRMVILTDGAINTGNTLEALQVAVTSGIDVQVFPLISEAGAEVVVRDIDAPQRLRVGDQIELGITLDSTRTGPVQILVTANGNLVYEGTENINRGTQTLSLPLTAQEQGFTAFQVLISSLEDEFYQNNQLSTYSQISGPPRVLIVAPTPGEPLGSRDSIRPDEFSPLRDALSASGYEVDVSTPYLMPSELPLLANYASIVLIDVPARQFTSSQMASLQVYVRELGGGLVAIGGPTSYGVGGYFKTPLEEILPVEMQIKDEQRRPSLAMIFIIDHSGSMTETSGGPTKLELAKEAVIRSVELLNPNDLVGVIAFDDAASWVSPVLEVGDGVEIRNKVASIGIGGGTDILAGVQAMAQVAPGIEAGSKHIILLTDGGADPTGIPELVGNLYSTYGITLSAIGVGQDAAPFLSQLADIGGGRYHFAADPSSIPNIYTEETTLATRAYIIEEIFVPEKLSLSPIIDIIEGLPNLYGYVGTSSKASAQTILISPKEDPILASWRYGLGKAVAFTSDASGRWAKDWVSWQNFSLFWSQVVRYTISDDPLSALDVQVKNESGKANIIVDAFAPPDTASVDGGYLNNYMMTANIIFPSGESKTVTLGQTAPGRYEANFNPQEEGVYILRISGESPLPDGPSVSETAGWALDYSPEYKELKSDPDQLVRYALQSGSKIAGVDPAEIFKHNLPNPDDYQTMWPYLTAMAAFLLPFDIAIRRMVINRNDVIKVFTSVREILKVKHPPQTATDRTETLSGLFKAKQAANEKIIESQFAPEPEKHPQTRMEYSQEIKSYDPIKNQSFSESPRVDRNETENIQDKTTEDSNRKSSPNSSVQALLARKRALKDSHDDTE